MLFNYIAESYITQVVLIVAVAAVICYLRTQRHIEGEADKERQEKRALAALTTRSSAPGETLPKVLHENG